MMRKRPNDLALCVEKFFREYLPTLRGMSQHRLSIWSRRRPRRSSDKSIAPRPPDDGTMRCSR